MDFLKLLKQDNLAPATPEDEQAIIIALEEGKNLDHYLSSVLDKSGKKIAQLRPIKVMYTLNDTTAYGLYNGISQYDIETLVSQIAYKKYNLSVLYADSEAIAHQLTHLLKSEAQAAWQPYPENPHWSDEYLEIHHQAIANHTAAGYAEFDFEYIAQKVDEICYKIYLDHKDEIEVAQREELAREERKQSMTVKILKQGKASGSDGPDYFAEVLITDNATGENAKFSCRNIFDFGYVINPMYAVAPGLNPGGIHNNGKWQDFNPSKGGWIDVRSLTDFERKATDYLTEFSPIGTGIRL